MGVVIVFLAVLDVIVFIRNKKYFQEEFVKEGGVKRVGYVSLPFGTLIYYFIQFFKRMLKK